MVQDQPQLLLERSRCCPQNEKHLKMLASRNEFQMKPARTAHLQWPCCHRAVAPCIDCRRIASQVVEDVPREYSACIASRVHHRIDPEPFASDRKDSESADLVAHRLPRRYESRWSAFALTQPKRVQQRTFH